MDATNVVKPTPRTLARHARTGHLYWSNCMFNDAAYALANETSPGAWHYVTKSDEAWWLQHFGIAGEQLAPGEYVEMELIW